jgi:hypothetical protein
MFCPVNLSIFLRGDRIDCNIGGRVYPFVDVSLKSQQLQLNVNLISELYLFSFFFVSYSLFYVFPFRITLLFR